jgi:hypothetical protein
MAKRLCWPGLYRTHNYKYLGGESNGLSRITSPGLTSSTSSHGDPLEACPVA